MQLLWTTITIAVLIPFSLAAQDGQPLTLNISASEMQEVTDRLTVRVGIVNSSDSDITVTKTVLELPSEFVAPPRSQFIEFVDGAFDLNPQGFRETEARVPGLSLRNALGLVFFRHKSYTGAVRVEYQVVPHPDRRVTAAAQFTLSPLGPWWAVAIGGMLGVMIINIFRAL